MATSPSFKNSAELHQFLTYFAQTDADVDEKTAQELITRTPTHQQIILVAQIKTTLTAANENLIEELGMEANRWFSELTEAKTWLQKILSLLEATSAGAVSDSIVVKDSNGTPLADGDAVQVIKDLKVKGGSSDLKRGTLIKKIRLIGDPENIECNVDGSTLVLKTMFLKKT
jgi:protein PhnA